MSEAQTALFKKLASLQIETETVEHPAVFTVEEARLHTGHLTGTHSKNLFLKDRKGNLFLVTTKDDTQIDLKNIHMIIGAKGRVSFGKAELLEEVLGVQPGSVTPFAVINDSKGRVKMFLDKSLNSDRMQNFHPLVNTATTRINFDDLVRFLEACDHSPEIISL